MRKLAFAASVLPDVQLGILCCRVYSHLHYPCQSND